MRNILLLQLNRLGDLVQTTDGKWITHPPDVRRDAHP